MQALPHGRTPTQTLQPTFADKSESPGRRSRLAPSCVEVTELLAFRSLASLGATPLSAGALKKYINNKKGKKEKKKES